MEMFNPFGKLLFLHQNGKIIIQARPLKSISNIYQEIPLYNKYNSGKI